MKPVTVHGMLPYQAVLVVFLSLWLYCFFINVQILPVATNTCFTKHSLRQRSSRLDAPLTLRQSLAQPSGVGCARRGKRIGWAAAGCRAGHPATQFWWTLASVLRKVRARLVADFVPGLVSRINLNAAAKTASQFSTRF